MAEIGDVGHLVMAVEKMADIQATDQAEFKEYRKEQAAKTDKLVEVVGKVEVALERVSNTNEAVSRAFIEIEGLKDGQKNGCSFAIQAVKDRDSRVELLTKDVEANTKGIDRLTGDIDKIKNLPNQILWRVVLVVTGLLTTAFMLNVTG